MCKGCIEHVVIKQDYYIIYDFINVLNIKLHFGVAISCIFFLSHSVCKLYFMPQKIYSLFVGSYQKIFGVMFYDPNIFAKLCCERCIWKPNIHMLPTKSEWIMLFMFNRDITEIYIK